MDVLEPFTTAGIYVNDVVERGDDVVRSIYGREKYEAGRPEAHVRSEQRVPPESKRRALNILCQRSPQGTAARMVRLSCAIANLRQARGGLGVRDGVQTGGPGRTDCGGCP